MKKIAISLCLLVGIGCVLGAGFVSTGQKLPGEGGKVDEINAVVAAGTWHTCVDTIYNCTANGAVSTSGCSASTVGSTCGAKSGPLNEKCRTEELEYGNAPCRFFDRFCANYYICREVPGWLVDTYLCDVSGGAPPAYTRVDCEVN